MWLLAGIDTIEAWCLFGATFLEFAVPVLVLHFFIKSVANMTIEDNQGVVGMIAAFTMALSLTYILSLTVLANILAFNDTIGFRYAAPMAFTARNIHDFGEYMIVLQG